jgi:NadR type nicotinamide-nucleotide adenylyltransferase
MTTGMLLGKFMPPHLGHVYLGEFASRYVDRLTIVVCSLTAEPIPGELRYRWMRELFPFDHVVHLTDDLPQHPGEHPDFWVLWRSALERVLPGRPDFVFASEDYGRPLAAVLGGTFVPVDRDRSAVPTSGSAIRADPMRHWDYLPRCVRPHFVKRVCVFGPESTGKTTLARRLAEHFGTAWVPEYARTLLEAQQGRLDPADLPRIVCGQIASEDALARNARRVLVCDTDPLTTLIWSEVLYGACDPYVGAQADQRNYDLYLLLDVDVPWVADVARYLPEGRQTFFERCRDELARRSRRCVVLRGGWDERFAEAVRAVGEVVGPAASSMGLAR